ncbi:peptidoglycan-binding protein [Kitasatospora sp. NPDC048365]|uniref:peptidoglycan-binding protein n=1 Tax=Kitasatospora sp. NPDC048365 TaxID=3364050 RepID=UPI00371BBC65
MSGTSSRRRRLGLLTTAVAIAAASAGGALLLRPGGGPAQAPAAHGPAVTTKITRQTLATTNSLTGELGYGTATPIRSRAGGTVTWLPEVGATVSRGEVLLRADNLPVVLMYGSLPVYRTLGLDAKGPDVEQFERNLAALGYTGFTVDDTFSATTVAAVKRWQKALGRPETGQLTADAVVFAPEAVRIAARTARIGADATGDVLTATGPAKVVTAQVRVNEAAWAVAGRTVQVAVPGGRTTEAVVARIGSQASSGQADGEGGAAAGGGAAPAAQNATLPVTLTVADQAALGPLESSPVDIRWNGEERKDVLTVPVAALLALAEGGYGLELVEGGTTRTVAVRTGLFADGRVEVSGPDLAADLTVGLPG